MPDRLTILIYHFQNDLPQTVLDHIVQFVEASGFPALGTSSRSEALEIITHLKPDVILIIPTADADVVLARDVTQNQLARVVILAGTDAIAELAKSMGIEDVVMYDEEDMGNILELIGHSFSDEEMSAASEPVNLMVVDDDVDILRMLLQYLSTKGYAVQSAGSGKETLDVLQRRKDVRVVLLDIRLPDMGGFEALTAIKALPNPPEVIMLSGIHDSGLARQALRLGAFDYLTKPVDFQTLDDAITACLARTDYHRRRFHS